MTSMPALVLFCEAMQGDETGTGTGLGQFGSSPSHSLPLAGFCVACGVPGAVGNELSEPQQMLKCEEPGPGPICTRFFASIIVTVFERLVAVKVTTPSPRVSFVHDRRGKPPPVAASTSLKGPVAAAANPEVPFELTVWL